jgi:hypothetical protein
MQASSEYQSQFSVISSRKKQTPHPRTRVCAPHGRCEHPTQAKPRLEWATRPPVQAGGCGDGRVHGRSVEALLTLEDHVLEGGFGTAVLEQLNKLGLTTPVVRVG